MDTLTVGAVIRVALVLGVLLMLLKLVSMILNLFMQYCPDCGHRLEEHTLSCNRPGCCCQLSGEQIQEFYERP